MFMMAYLSDEFCEKENSLPSIHIVPQVVPVSILSSHFWYNFKHKTAIIFYTPYSCSRTTMRYPLLNTSGDVPG